MSPGKIRRSKKDYYEHKFNAAKSDIKQTGLIINNISNIYEKITNLQHQLDNTAGENGSAKTRKQVYWGRTRINK